MNIIFPMAGEGSRFGYVFKPFINILNETFIQRALNPFKKYDNTYYFVFLDIQEETHKVSEKLDIMFGDLIHKNIILHTKTRGAAETLIEALEIENITGETIVCDCDHSLSVDFIFNQTEKCDILFPLWNLDNENIKDWGIAVVVDNKIIDIAEKKIPEKAGINYGVMGCHYFRDISIFKKYYSDEICMTDFIKKYIGILNIRGELIDNVEFFGNPEKLNKILNKNAI